MEKLIKRALLGDHEAAKLTHLSLFSGIGGLDLAAEMAGFRTVGQCEWADYPTKVLEKHWPDVPRWRDIRTLIGDDFYERTGLRTVDVVSGGFPCQPFSVAGKRRGKEDDRYLWPEMLRVISELRPAWVVGENVAGIVNMALDQVYTDLENEGYTVQALIIPACAVDAPHRRDRCAIVAWDANRRDRDAWAEREVEKRENAKPAGICENVSDTNEIRCDLRGFGRKGIHGNPPCYETDSSSETMENADGNGCGRPRDLCELRCVQKEVGKRETNFPCKPSQVRGTMAHADHGSRLVRRDGEFPTVEETAASGADHRGRAAEYVAGEWWTAQPGLGGMVDGFSYWLDEPTIPRIATGIPDRVNRLKCLGNAVVPQQFYPIFQAIADIERGIIHG